MNIVFFGSSEFSIPALEACLEPGNKVLLVITTPDRKKGRGLKDAPTPVKEYALKANLPVADPENLKDAELIERVRSLAPELFVVSSYGKFIPSSWLKIPSRLCLNVHPSLLPKYRGAAPINWPILNGDEETGVSIIEVTNKLDAGDIFFQARFKIPGSMNAAELSDELARLSFKALQEVFAQIEKGTLKRTAQDETLSTYARKLEKEDGLLHWDRTAAEIVHSVRGLLPWPAAYIDEENGQPLQILAASVLDPMRKNGKPGEILSVVKPRGIEVQSSKGSVLIEKVKPSGKKELSAYDFANGRRLKPGLFFGKGT